jgi:HK97 family phage portal protein
MGAVTEGTALQVAAVYGSCGVISDAVSTLPIDLLTSPDPTKRQRLAASQLLTQPYAEISTIDWLVQYVMSLALRGNFYGHIISRDRNLYATQIKPVHPDNVTVRRALDGQIEYRFNNQAVPREDVLHIRYMSVAGSLQGLNPIEYLRNSIGLAHAADSYGGAFFANSALPSGVISVADELEEDETLALARSWSNAHQGIGKAQLPAVLTGGATFQPISITPEDAQFLQSRQFSQGEISGMIFRVPPHMIGIVDRSTSWGTGIEQQERGFIANTLAGYLFRLETQLTALHPPGQYVRFDLKARERGDKLQRYQAYALGINGSFLCPDDARAEEGLPPVPGGLGQTFLSPINSATLQAAVDASLNPPAKDAPAASTDAPPDGGAI